jgi:hypothetical protein
MLSGIVIHACVAHVARIDQTEQAVHAHLAVMAVFHAVHAQYTCIMRARLRMQAR